MTEKHIINKSERKSLISKIIIRFTLFPLVLGLLTVLPAGTFNYWEVYAFFSIIVLPMVFVIIYFFRNDPMFLERRTKTRETEKTQKIVLIVFSVFFLSAFVVSGLDKRYGWSEVPWYIVVSADVIILLGYVLIFFVFKQNSYASRVVEVGHDQQLITTGLYGIVRHPMYVGVIVMYIPLPVALGSYWGLIPVAVIPLAIILRILNEEALLIRDLPGYDNYCKKVKYRLIPYIW